MQIRLEDLVGTRVRGLDGEVVGRIREVQAEWRGARCVVTELHVGTGMLLRRRPRGVRVPMDVIDLSDPARPRLRVPARTLEPLR